MKEPSFFNKSQTIAIIGVSENKKKFGYYLFDFMKKHGYSVVPVNPKAKEILGNVCYNSIDSLPAEVKKAIIMTPKTQTDKVLKQLHEHGINDVWVQQMCQTTESKEITGSLRMNAIFNRCVLMFAEPVTGIHAFHRWFWNLFSGARKKN